MATIINGKETARRVRGEVAGQVASLRDKGISVKLTVIQVGDDPASTIYVRNKERACSDTGIESEIIRLDKAVTQEDLLCEISRLNGDDSVDGILVQLPLPDHLDEQTVKEAIDPRKDVDGFHPLNTGRLLAGEEALLPCTPAGIIRLLDEYEIPIEGSHCVVIGRSQIVGKPMAVLLLERNATVTVCHSHTRDLASHTRQADILISAVGRPKMVGAEYVKEGAVVIDVAINRSDDGKLCGDVDFDAVSPVCTAITPVPGGVGPMTVAMLLMNCLTAAKRKAVVL